MSYLFWNQTFFKRLSADKTSWQRVKVEKLFLTFASKPFEPVHEISSNVVCATSKASDQPAHTHSLIRAFACCLSMIVKLLTEHHLEFLSLKGGCRGSSESTIVKMSNCWKSRAAAQFSLFISECHKAGSAHSYTAPL